MTRLRERMIRELKLQRKSPSTVPPWMPTNCIPFLAYQRLSGTQLLDEPLYDGNLFSRCGLERP